MSNSKNLVIEVSSQVNANVTHYYKVESLPVSIGRGFDNDLILNDPFICGNHLNVTHDDDTENWIVKELDTENGFSVNDKNYGAKFSQQSIVIKSGDCICIGKTILKIYASDHQIKKTQALVRPHSLLSKLENKRNSWLLFILSILVIVFYNYQGSWTKDSKSTIALASVALAVFMILWSAGWALVGRINRHKSYFSEQIGIISIYTILTMWVYSGLGYLSFVLHENILSQIVDSVLFVVCLWGLLYGSLSFASNMQRKKCFRSSGMIAVGAMIVVLVIGFMESNSFSSSPRYSSFLKPYFVSWGKHNNIKSYMASNKELFEDSALKILK